MTQLLKIMEALEEKSHEEKMCKTHYEEIFGERQLKLLRFSTCESIFMTILKNYIDSLPMRVRQQDENVWLVDDNLVGVRQKLLFCECGYSIKCGIPCSHVLKLIFLIHEDVLQVID